MEIVCDIKGDTMMKKDVLIHRDENKLWVNSKDKCELRLSGLLVGPNVNRKVAILEINPNFIDIAVFEEEYTPKDGACAIISKSSILIAPGSEFEYPKISISCIDKLKVNGRPRKGEFMRTKRQIQIYIE